MRAIGSLVCPNATSANPARYLQLRRWRTGLRTSSSRLATWRELPPPSRIADGGPLELCPALGVRRMPIAGPRRQSETGISDASLQACGMRRTVEGAGRVHRNVAALSVQRYDMKVERLVDLRSRDVPPV